ncbi:PASTA domain-containing protein [Lutibacter sp. HS1-25]|uniref:PASTA domain-containing protein n=1 Tax=Lutibacter sp. HS1-25 TaxID=2485000 RepID=UPI0010127BCD|nr:PASTA domain-containing protein [Lutibacter sp. HS1-25]RXP58617.1 PASTA domain-containing protein [Lutibacter sp. HS1-25]
MSLFQFLKSKSFVKQLIIAFVAFIVFSFAVVKWLNITTNHDQKIEVPSLEKLGLMDVENLLEDLNLNFVVIDSASYNPDFPPQSVIEQSPEAGSFVKADRKIYLTLNPSGYEVVAIPSVFGKTKRQATSQLIAVGFRVDTAKVYIPDIAKDVVRGLLINGVDFNTGDKIARNSVITLKLGDGEGAEKEEGVSDDIEVIETEEIE